MFLSCVMSKKYPHPSSDIIAVLGGLDYIDTIFTDFVGALDGIIRNGQSCKETSTTEEDQEGTNADEQAGSGYTTQGC